MKRIDTRWLSNPDAKPAKELSQHDQDMIQLGWDAAKSMCEEKVREIRDTFRESIHFHHGEWSFTPKNFYEFMQYLEGEK